MASARTCTLVLAICAAFLAQACTIALPVTLGGLASHHNTVAQKKDDACNERDELRALTIAIAEEGEVEQCKPSKRQSVGALAVLGFLGGLAIDYLLVVYFAIRQTNDD